MEQTQMNIRNYKYPFFIILFVFLPLFNGAIFSQSQEEVDKFPEYPGGNAELKKFIIENSEFPDDSRLLYSSGTVVFNIIIDEKGTTRTLNSFQTNDKSINNSFEDLLSKMQKWIPAKKGDSCVSFNTALKMNYILATSPEKSNKEFSNEFVKFKHYKSAKVSSSNNIVHVNGKSHGGNITIKKESSDFEIDDKISKIRENLNNPQIEVIERRGVIIKGKDAEVLRAKLFLSRLASSLVGDMEIKVYKISKESNFYSVVIIEFIDDVNKNFKQNATIMSSLEFN